MRKIIPLSNSYALVAAVITAAAFLFLSGSVVASPLQWAGAWPKTDFARTSIDLTEILTGGVAKDGIPSIDDPKFVGVARVSNLGEEEPVISLQINGEAKAYPLQILIWHEIVNDTVGGVPVAVTYCPLCNSGIAFERTVAGRILDFGTTGNLRFSDLVMYDRQTESWWQQFSGEAIIGEMMGTVLTPLPARMESFARFKKRVPGGLVLVPSNRSKRPYGKNPYVAYDSAKKPFLFRGNLPKDIDPMVRVIVVDDQAWSLPFVRKMRRITLNDLEITWTEGQNSALDADMINEGRDVGNVVARRTVNGAWVDVVYHVTFAFVFHAFHPDKRIRTR